MPMPLFCSIRTCISRLICLFTLCYLPALALSAPPAAAQRNRQLWLLMLACAICLPRIGLSASTLVFCIFKSESVLEVWAADQAAQAMTLVKTYPVCAMSGELRISANKAIFKYPKAFIISTTTTHIVPTIYRYASIIPMPPTVP